MAVPAPRSGLHDLKLNGIHRVTCITADAVQNLEFYRRALGLRLMKKTVNQDAISVCHLFHADDAGAPGSAITFFEHPGARTGQAGAGMAHTVVWRVASESALEFWATRLSSEGVSVANGPDGLLFDDPESLRHTLVASQSDDEPLVAGHPEIPTEHALAGLRRRARPRS
jgi:glyoxalase family protein